MASDLSTAITTAAGNPKRVRGDEGEVENHDIKDLIEADKHLSANTTVNNTGFGLKVARAKMPSALGQ